MPKRALTALLGATLVGCATAPAPRTPAEVAEAQASAVRAGDLARAQGLLTAAARARDWPWPRPPSGPVDPAREVSREARWSLDEGRVLVLLRDTAGWRLAGAVLDLAATPKLLLRTLARALREPDYDLLYSLLPESERKRWSAKTLALAIERPGVREAWQGLAQVLGDFDGAVATFEGGTRARVEVGSTALLLGREVDGWKILDAQPAGSYTVPRTEGQ